MLISSFILRLNNYNSEYLRHVKSQNDNNKSITASRITAQPFAIKLEGCGALVRWDHMDD